jgi:5'-methylthioadenosine phosphorylase
MAIEIGIIGGSGLYDMAELTDREDKVISTPFGDPSGPYVLGTLRGKRSPSWRDTVSGTAFCRRN